ncbi:MAG: pseudouridine-5'-phosphate glycosidase, partial [Acidobacteria bacterium ACB2]|nr:pseudouridine-5'-phosphate glycosidase [Acidobacteria bacterium ACB2]
MTILRVAPEVTSALSAGRPVVALETTIFSRLGLPEPAGRDCLTRVLSAVRQEGAVPAPT